MVRKSDKSKRRRSPAARVSATEASRSFASILDQVEDGATITVHRRGRNICVMASPRVSARKMSECIELLLGRTPVVLDDRFGHDLVEILAEEPAERRPWDS